jgi:hypothetical protein
LFNIFCIKQLEIAILDSQLIILKKLKGHVPAKGSRRLVWMDIVLQDDP